MSFHIARRRATQPPRMIKSLLRKWRRPNVAYFNQTKDQRWYCNDVMRGERCLDGDVQRNYSYCSTLTFLSLTKNFLPGNSITLPKLGVGDRRDRQLCSRLIRTTYLHSLSYFMGT